MYLFVANHNPFCKGWSSLALVCPSKLAQKHTQLTDTPAWRVQPRNYLLFACHTTNATAQSIQGIRFVNYWYYGGREKKLGMTGVAEESVTQAVKSATEETKKLATK
jgi:hypothetical protein